MKKIPLFLLPLLLLSLFISCEKNADPIDCDSNDCLFVLEEVSGMVTYMNCFERLAIQTQSPDNKDVMIYALPDQELNGPVANPDIPVIFTAKFRANTLEPQFPDPSIGPETIYQVDLVEVKLAQ